MRDIKNMYKIKDKIYGLIAVAYYLIFILGLWSMGYLFKMKFNYYYIPYILLFIVAITIVLKKDKSFDNLGFSKEKLKINMIISSVMILAVFVFSAVLSSHPIHKLFKAALYYLFYIALVEEILFRGFLQSYLFGFKLRKSDLFLIGGIFFSVSHLPFQIFAHDIEPVAYILNAFSQLVFTFVFHMLMCFITYKRKDITIPVAIHFVIDYLQNVL